MTEKIQKLDNFFFLCRQESPRNSFHAHQMQFCFQFFFLVTSKMDLKVKGWGLKIMIRICTAEKAFYLFYVVIFGFVFSDLLFSLKVKRKCDENNNIWYVACVELNDFYRKHVIFSAIYRLTFIWYEHICITFHFNLHCL